MGSIFAVYSHTYFGYLSYVYLFLLVYPLYKINFIQEESREYLKYFGVFTFLLSALILQSLIFTKKDIYSGVIGNSIVDTLYPFVGFAGLWLLVLIGFLIVFLIFIDGKEIKKLDVQKIASNIKKDVVLFQPKPSESKREKRREERLTVKEVGDTAEILIMETSSDEKKSKKEKPVEEKITENSEEKHSIIVDELEENKKLQDEIEVGESEKPKDFKLPSSNFFQTPAKVSTSKINEDIIDKKIADLLEKLLMFKIEGDVVRTYTGPVVTTFEFKPAPHVKVSKVLNLQDDLAMALKAETIRIQAPIPGKDVIGIEVPNENMHVIYIKELLDSEIFNKAASPLTMILGKDIVGKPFITDLKKLPHLLIAGTTGSGKSVGLNAMILSLLYRNSPDNLKLIMIDPKMLEFSIYNDIPHLLTPVITKPKEAILALSNMVLEMERRYTLMSQTKTKNIENYNEKSKKEAFDPLPYIVVIIDELADLMMTSGKDVELSIARLAQMARASGIHLIVATQRPSVDVVTGLIKANLPSRISYKVGQKVDSKIILDAMGAESLLGRGDMLFTPPGSSGLVRLHAPWSKEDEIEKVVDFLKSQREVEYDMNFVKDKEGTGTAISSGDMSALDELYEDAKEVVLNDKKTSISYIQRKLRIGYNRAATIVEQLEMTGVLSEVNAKGNRDILL
ncbi:DNA translocase FtsK [uncultured Arcobacter sp.]|uniref:FtsK/SpoIIIE family DNA translocase n=1 Tax=uncultured Arcobacter sp. TaxID=165434 RepID=UPI00261FE6F8|nr:DNA translocase FtsK [uncultured Arcobacter sp.]